MTAFVAVAILLLSTAVQGQQQQRQGEESVSIVYTGTGVNGSTQRNLNNDVVVLGGLFTVHHFHGNSCAEIFELGVQNLESEPKRRRLLMRGQHSSQE